MVVIIGKLHFQQYFSHILIKFYWWRKPVYPKKTTDLPQATYKLNHKGCIEYTISGGKQLYRILCMLSLITMYYFFSITQNT